MRDPACGCRSKGRRDQRIIAGTRAVALVIRSEVGESTNLLLRPPSQRWLRRLNMIMTYAEMRTRSRVGERPLIALPKIPGELELQARWFAGDFGRQFTSTSGQPEETAQFGFWNREAGPDFQDAAARIGKDEVRRGAVEIDLLDRNWESHGH